MKQTEIGLIPDDWEVKRLNAICNNISSGKNQNRFVNGIYPVYGSTGIIGFCNNNKYSGDAILVARVGANAGLVNKVAGKYDVSDNTLVIQSDKCDIDYLSRLLTFRNLNQLIFGSGQPLITGGQLKALLIQLPSLTEQQRIAKALSDVDALIFTTEKLLQKKKNIKQGTMQNLLTGKKRLPGFAKSTNYKQSELGLIPEDWEVMSLGEISTIIMGQSPNSDCYNTQKGMVLIQGNADISNSKTICRFYTTHITKTARKGDVIFTVRAPVGNVAKATFDCCLGRGVCAIQSISDFLYYYLIFIEDSWSKTSTGSTFDSINSDTLASTLIIQPYSKEEQTAIANVLSSMDKEIETLNTKLEKYRNLKTAMMQQLLTGKIRLIK